MLSAAIHMSLQTARSQPQNNEAGPSSSGLISSNPRAALHAAAAERRLASAIGDVDQDFEYMFDGLMSASEDEAPKKTKGKAKNKPATNASNVMTYAELRRRTREARRNVKQEEAELVGKLGRRLTQVKRNSLNFSKSPILKPYQGREDYAQVAEASPRTTGRLG
jgi:DNA repair protein RAD16